MKKLKIFASLREDRVRVAILLIASFLLIWVGNKYGSEILSGLAVELIGAAVVFFILENKIGRLAWSKLEEYPNLPVKTFIQQISKSKDKVRILDIWLATLTKDEFSDSFRDALVSAVNNNATVQILIIEPDGEAAQQRARELSKALEDALDIQNLIQDKFDDLKLLRRVVNRRTELSENRIEIRTYNVLPSIAMYQSDNILYWSFFPLDGISTRKLQLKLPVKTPLGRYLTNKFDETWENENTVPVEEI